jgi:hypothetical protein
MVMVLEDESEHARQTPRATADLIEKRATFEDRLRKTGALVDSGRLRPSREGKRVRGDAVKEGPFGDKELGVYYWIEADGAEAAARIAGEHPGLPSDEIDVRPLMKGRVDGEKDGKPGKVFAFAVLGSAANEEAWVSIMDRIDAEGRGTFPLSGSVGGVRLQPPTKGRRLTTRGMFDGPFYESKEVIGGIFFVRMPSIEDAVRWAGETRFVIHGTLEIRELWRS